MAEIEAGNTEVIVTKPDGVTMTEEEAEAFIKMLQQGVMYLPQQ